MPEKWPMIARPYDSKLLSDALETLNESNAVVSLNGRTFVMCLDSDSIVYSPLRDFKDFKNRTKFIVPRTRNDKLVNVEVGLGDEWINWPNRRQYKGVTFSPNGCHLPKDHYNLWQGFAVVPNAATSWNRLREHIFHNICDSNESHFNYVLAWLAQGIQDPGTVPEVALVLKSELKGTGKSLFARYYRSLFGKHGFTTSNPHHLVGRFNAHLESVICLVLEEAFFTGQHSHESILKTLITEPTLAIEPKGLPVRVVKNYLRVIMASNDEWVVPAGLSERRYCVLEVNPRQAQNTSYFERIAREMENGGLEAMLYELMIHDYSSINLRHPPITDSLIEQKIHSLDAKYKWWYEKLNNGRLLETHKTWKTEVEKEELRLDYEQAMLAASRRESRSVQTELGIFLRKMCDNRLPTRRVTKDSSRPYVFILPTLEQCREIFCKQIGTDITWLDIDSDRKQFRLINVSGGYG